MCSSSEDRPRAFAVIGLSVIVSLIVGPGEFCLSEPVFEWIIFQFFS